VLEGRIVRLEPLTAAHGPGLRTAAAHDEIWTWIRHPPPAISDAEWEAFLGGALAASAAGTEAAFATLDARTGAPIGSTRFLTLRPEHRGLEIGWTWLTPTAWRTGANAEAKLLQLTHAFETLGCLRVELKTNARNRRSRVAMARLGATHEGVFRRHQLLPGIGDGVRDSAFFSITDRDWPAVRARLEARLSR
jgi:RimJ/RimL family protein N-acetyltransferase